MNIGDRVKVVGMVGYHEFLGDEGVIVQLTELGIGSDFEVEVDFEEFPAVPFLKSELEVLLD
jgi:hypothetical protein